MTDLLKEIIDVLPDSQKRAIKSLLERKKKTGESPSLRAQQQQITDIYNRVKANLGSKLLSPRYAVKDEKISSGDHNKNMEEIFLDLNALYINIDQLGKQSAQQTTTITSEYEKSKAAIYRLLSDASTFALRKKYPDFNEVKMVDFNVSSNETKRSPSAVIDSRTRLLQLKPINFTRAHLADRGTRSTKVYTKTYAKGIKGTLSKTFSPSLMIDQYPETFWGTLIMSDTPISQVYDVTSKNGDTNKIGVDGPVTEIYLQFSHIELLNTIRMLPFSEYPVDIIDVSYRSSPSSQLFTTVKDFYKSSTLDWEELNFDTVYAYELRIVIAQPNYKQVIYHLPKSLTINTDLFQQIFNLQSNQIISDNTIPDSDSLLSILKTVSSYQSASELLQEVLIASGADNTLTPEAKYYDDILSILNQVYSTIDSTIADNTILLSDSQTEIIEINKYEYILGMREVEAGYTLYSPISYYETNQYNTDATISQVAIEVDERHTLFNTQWENDFRQTSVEWELDLGDGKKIPIHPRNIVDQIDTIPSVKDERLFFEQGQAFALTRLGGYYSTIYRLKKDGNLIPSTDYSVSKVTGATPRLRIDLTGTWNDNSIYTVDYAVDPDSYTIQVLDKFNSVPLDTPEIFNTVGSDNDITLSKYPFINYEVINLTGQFTKDETDNSWVFYPSQNNISSGQLRVTPTILDDGGNILQTGSLTGYSITGMWGSRSGQVSTVLLGNTNLSSAYFGQLAGVNFGYFIKVMDSYNFIEVSQFINSSSALFTDNFTASLEQIQRWDALATGSVFVGTLTGSQISGYLQADYTIGIGVKTDDSVFSISENRYTPITIKVGGVVAKNITDYETLQHPSFSIATTKDNEFQYIQAGKKIYFNQPINNQEIRVQYNWITNYVSLLATLRCNRLSNPDVTPKVNNVKILINNLVI